MASRTGSVVLNLVLVVAGVSVVGVAVHRNTSSVNQPGTSRPAATVTAADGASRLGLSSQAMAMSGITTAEAVAMASAARNAVPMIASAGAVTEGRTEQQAMLAMRAAWHQARNGLIDALSPESAAIMRRYDIALRAGVPTPAGVALAGDPVELKKYARAIRHERRAARMGETLPDATASRLSAARGSAAAQAIAQRMEQAAAIAQQIQSAE